MLKKKTAAFITGATLVVMLTGAVPVGAASAFGTCTQLQNKFRDGVAKSVAAADKQVRTGHYRPKVKPAVYQANRRLDTDNDGTACERKLGT